jgi:hypothetical protein
VEGILKLAGFGFSEAGFFAEAAGVGEPTV